jgi:hypothetical protein
VPAACAFATHPRQLIDEQYFAPSRRERIVFMVPVQKYGVAHGVLHAPSMQLWLPQSEPSSTMPSQSSSTPLHVSAAGVWPTQLPQLPLLHVFVP